MKTTEVFCDVCGCKCDDRYMSALIWITPPTPASTDEPAKPGHCGETAELCSIDCVTRKANEWFGVTAEGSVPDAKGERLAG